MIRALKPAHFALVEIRLYLLVGLVLLPCLSGFRPVVLRTASEANAMALLMVCAFVTVCMAVAFSGIMLIVESQNTYAVLVVASSLVFRAFSEIPLAFARRRERYEQSSRARAVSTVISAVSQTFAVSMITDQKYAPPATAVGHLAYSFSLGVLMYLACGSEPLPSFSWSTVSTNHLRDDLLMTAVATGEGMIKFLLENGEAIILDLVVATSIRSAYRLSSNIGSVLCRFFSEALEEQSFNVFHRLAWAFRSESSGRDAEDVRTTCVETMLLGLKAALTVSVLFVVIGPAYSYAFIRLLYGERWADKTPAPAMLDLYFVYLVFMSANGVSEAFVTASASTKELQSRTKFATVLSCIYLCGLFYAANTYQATGLVFANCLNMACRTCYSVWFFTRLTGKSVSVLRHAVPHPCVVLTLFVARSVSLMSEKYFMGDVAGSGASGTDVFLRVASHGMSGVFVLVLFFGSLLVFERRFVDKVRNIWKKREHDD